MAPFCNKSILLPILFAISYLAAARDTITPTSSLANNETLVSAGGTFSLGFFSALNSDRRYIGIWYNNITVQTIVWVANRADPVFRSSGQLSVTANGTIMVTDSNLTVVWYAGAKYGLVNPVLRLLDTGNLVLKEEGDNTQNYAWQSFDYPTDTLLPGMKLGVDKITGLNRTLTAWKGENDPSPGEYYAAMGISNNPEMYLFDRSDKLWRSGPWNGIQLGSIPLLNTYNGFIYSFANTYNELAFSYQATGQPIAPILRITRLGNIQLMIWLSLAKQWNVDWYAPANQCDIIGVCGTYGVCDSNNSPLCRCLQGFTPKNVANWELRDGSEGCVRNRELNCRTDGDTFVAVNGVKLPEKSSSLANTIVSLDACRSECLKNCSCTAYAISVGGGGCVIWVTELLDIVQLVNVGQDLYMRNGSGDAVTDLPSQHTDLPSQSKRNTVVIIVSLLLGILLLSCVSFFLWRRKKRTRVILEAINFFSGELDEDDHGKDQNLPLFNFSTIAAATESFSAGNKLGQGGFGPVYKGTLGGNKDIAVKRLSKGSQQGTDEFKNEINLIAKLQHKNLVRLLGCCIQGEERMLIYEYMSNKSLDAFLFEKEKAALLDWRTRYQIIVGITRGLLYLHHDSRFRIIHRDLKASNILLDGEMNPKISDFGMARLFGGSKTDFNTRKVVGTYGYMSPEYAMEGTFSMKSDVFSFGVLLLEIISGRKNRGSYAFSSHLNLVAHAWSLWKEDKSLELVDELMRKNIPTNVALRCIKIGLLCLQENPEERPLMSSVIEMLGVDVSSLPEPKQPGFISRTGPFELEHVPDNRDSSTSNGLTVTLDGR